jgi:formylglycine-generating enzyme required for sulfatase activity
MGAPAEECPEWDSIGQQNNPLHKVTLSPFRLHRFCVTNVEYELFDPRHKKQRWLVGEHPSVKKARDSSTDDRCPVVMVSWYDAWGMGKWLGVVPLGGKFYRIVLPTEGQWEYACRAGRTTPFTFHEGHDGQTCTPDVCNFNGNYPFPEGTKVRKDKGTTIYRQATLAVDALKGNPWGFWQMHGNVWEWCEDWYSIGFYGTEKGNKKDPVNDDAASARVLRGGGWISDGWFCRSALRHRVEPDFRFHILGFRLAAVPVVGAEPVQQGSGA